MLPSRAAKATGTEIAEVPRSFKSAIEALTKAIENIVSKMECYKIA